MDTHSFMPDRPRNTQLQIFTITQTDTTCLFVCASQTCPCSNEALVHELYHTYLQRERFPANKGLRGQHCLQNVRGHYHLAFRSWTAKTKTDKLVSYVFFTHSFIHPHFLPLFLLCSFLCCCVSYSVCTLCGIWDSLLVECQTHDPKVVCLTLFVPCVGAGIACW